MKGKRSWCFERVQLLRCFGKEFTEKQKILGSAPGLYNLYQVKNAKIIGVHKNVALVKMPMDKNAGHPL